MKKLLKFVIVVGLMFGGWALAAASLHVVRAPGTMVRGYVPCNVQLVTKNALTFHDTWVDTTKWTAAADLDAHKDVVARLEQLNKADLFAHARPSSTDAHASAAPTRNAPEAQQKPAPQAASTDKGQKSIFDFGH